MCNLEEPVSNDTTQIPNHLLTKSKIDDSSNAHQVSSATSSLFNDISNLPADGSDLGNPSTSRNEIDDFRLNLLDVLASGSNASEEQANNNGDYEDAQPTDHSHQYQTVPPSGIIVNETETGVARLIITSSNQPASVDRAPPCAPHNRRPQSTGSTNSQSQHSSQFAFNLPNVTVSDHSDYSSDHPPNHRAADNSPEPSRVTVTISVSNEGPDSRIPLLATNDDAHSDTDSSSSLSPSRSRSDLESSSSSSGVDSPRGSRRQLLVQPFLDEKSRSLRRRYQNSQELLQKLFICISGSKSV